MSLREDVLKAPGVREWVKQQIIMARQRDCVDALHDAELLARVLEDDLPAEIREPMRRREAAQRSAETAVLVRPERIMLAASPWEPATAYTLQNRIVLRAFEVREDYGPVATKFATHIQSVNPDGRWFTVSGDYFETLAEAVENFRVRAARYERRAS